jgi:Helix-turn-helix domain
MATPSFAELLRQHRLARGLTQEELAERAGQSPRSATVSGCATRRSDWLVPSAPAATSPGRAPAAAGS